MDELEKKINNIIAKVIESIADKYLTKLKEYITKYVYEPNEPKQYERTGEFLESFDKLPQVKKVMGEFLQEIYFNPNKLSYKKQDNGFWQHGIEGYDFREKMASILNYSEQNSTYSQAGGALNVGVNGYYWEAFKEYIDSHLVNDLKAEFTKHGLNIK